jgi:hypothetical protein
MKVPVNADIDLRKPISVERKKYGQHSTTDNNNLVIQHKEQDKALPLLVKHGNNPLFESLTVEKMQSFMSS